MFYQSLLQGTFAPWLRAPCPLWLGRIEFHPVDRLGVTPSSQTGDPLGWGSPKSREA